MLALRRKMRLIGMIVLAGVVWALAPAWAAPPSASAILRRALDLSSGVQDYSASIRVTSDLQSFPQNAPALTVYFKRPDKVRIKSRSIAVVRKDMFTFGNLAQKVEQGAQVTLLGSKTVDGVLYYTLKLAPKQAEHGPAARTLVVVNGQRWTVDRMEVFEGAQSMVTMNWRYALVGGRYWMPSRIDCAIPSAPGRDGTRGGHLTVTFSDYRVNQGLSDAFFAQPKGQ